MRQEIVVSGRYGYVQYSSTVHDMYWYVGKVGGGEYVVWLGRDTCISRVPCRLVWLQLNYIHFTYALGRCLVLGDGVCFSWNLAATAFYSQRCYVLFYSTHCPCKSVS